MAKSDARFGYQAKLSRESHDLSRVFGFTAAPGMLLPIFADFASAGDTYYIEHDLSFLRTAPLAAPAMIDVKVHYESFFVPFQMIYQPIEQTLYSLNNFQSSLFNISNTNLMNNGFPVLNYSDYITNVVATSNTANFHVNAFRFADMMDLDAANFCGLPLDFMKYKPNFFPWQALAYHAIFQYYYRLDDKSQFDNSLFNWDRFYDNTSAVTMGGTSAFFEIYQRPWRFDYFTSMYRSPIVSNSNMQKILPMTQYQDFFGENTVPVKSDGVYASAIQNDDIHGFASGISAGSSYVESTFRNAYRASYNTAMIRQMFANEKLSMITGRTRKTYDAQVLAHIGVNVPHDPKHDIAFIGGDTYDLHVGEVTALATTLPSGGNPGTALGDLAGKGFASGHGKKHKFTAPCHGVVMTIFSIEPRKRYYGSFARQNAVSDAFDFPTPEFDRLGNQPMYRYEAGQAAASFPMSDIIGWKERYYSFKRRYDKVSLAFMSGIGGNSNVYNSYMIASAPFGIVDVSNPTYRVAAPEANSRFYIDRHACDGLMLVPYADGWIVPAADAPADAENWNHTPWLVYSRDPFIVDSYEKVTKVSWMSKDGEPVYDF